MKQSESIELLRKLAPECMVLLRTDGSFPVKKPREIALYGNGIRHTRRGGTGSGDVNVDCFVNVEAACQEEGIHILTDDWLNYYDEVLTEAEQMHQDRMQKKADELHIPLLIASMGEVMPEPEYQYELHQECDTAIYVLARTAGEGADRKDILGDYRLTMTEQRDIRRLADIYPQFLLVLNTGGAVDLTGLEDITNILLLSQLGSVTGYALLDVVLGRSYPSGHLAATWNPISAFDQIDSYGEKDDTLYNEKLMVGYRYFSSTKRDTTFCFGYGLSYTKWQVTMEKCIRGNLSMWLEICVRNVGDYTGKEIIQVYSQPPNAYEEMPGRELRAYHKTRELQPQEAEIIEIEVPYASLCSYNEEDNSWKLKKGQYTIWFGTDVEHLQQAGYIDVDEEEELPPYDVNQPSRITEDQRERIHSFIKSSSTRELIHYCIGQYDDGSHRKNIIGDASDTVEGAAGETAHLLQENGMGRLIMADGPAGIRVNGNSIAIPIGTALAQSWNEELLNACGQIVAGEMKRIGVQLWLAPAMNIQRHPLCGRNFEYYSEDPYLSGKMAAAMICGVQSMPGCGVTIKHYACNNQETNRFHSNSVVDTRTLREIYLRGFEIAVEEGRPVALMTSYNLLNGCHTCNDKNLIMDILRNEWKFSGLVMTDWFVTGFGLFNNEKYPCASAAGCIYAGNDLIMPGGKKDETEIIDAIEKGNEEYPLIRMDLEQCVQRILEVMTSLQGNII